MMSQMENLEIDKSNPSEDVPENIESLEQKEELPEGGDSGEEKAHSIQKDIAEDSTSAKEESNSSKNRNRKNLNQFQKEFDSFTELLESQTDFDVKLKLAIDKMEHYLSQGGTPQFKYFWELRKLALVYFKENITPNARATLWPKYSELSKEARRLKEMFDEQSAFAVEQINMAIDGLEAEVTNFEECISKHEDIDFQFQSQFLQDTLANYNDQQKRLNLLNAHAARVNTLRKELMKVDMRVKQKNKFFQRLSEAGDKIFPLRKELIKNLSDQFILDVNRFIETYFSKEEAKDSVFFLREEIKSLQGIAKMLTLNTHSFTSTRLRLSELWDKLKNVDKERRKERAEKKEVFKQNSDEIHKKILEFIEKFQTENLPFAVSNKILDEIQKHMRDVELGRDEVKLLKEELNNARKLVSDKSREEELNRQEEEWEKLQVKKGKVDLLKQQIDNLISGVHGFSLKEIESSREALYLEIVEFKDLSTRERNDLERPLRALNDVIDTKREELLLNLSEDDQEALKNLKEVLKQRKKRRKEIKDSYDSLRKLAGSSGLDFEKAMLHNEQLNIEKERLDIADAGIAEMEDKILEFRNKS